MKEKFNQKMANVRCSHCRLSFDESSMIDENGLKFCCNGCKNVYEVVHGAGLNEFYTRLGKNELSPAKTISTHNKEALKNLYKNYVINENGFNKIHLIIQGIHCSACIWLNEKVLFGMQGIIEATINATNNKATIVWDETQVSLAEILTAINSIGYNAYAYDVSREEAVLSSKRREFYIKLLVGIFATMNIMWIAIAQYSGYFLGMSADVRDMLNFAEFIIATPVLFYTGGAFFAGAKVAIKTKTPNMDMLIATGASLAYLYSIWAMFTRHGEVYFDSVAMIITFVFAGKFLEVLSKKRANDTIDSLSSMVINEVAVKSDNGVVSKDINEIKIGDIIVLKAGDKVLIDGVISSGEASFDYTRISGESVPVLLGAKSEIKSGAICLDGYVQYKATAVFKNSLLNKIITMLENANLKKPKIEQFANIISAKFSITILSIAMIAFGVWLYVAGFEKALVVAISVIVIACPCALALATPVSTLVGLGVGLKKSVIFKESRIIESLAKCDVVVFDKTGTLTKGALNVENVFEFLGVNKGAVLALANSSKHPVSVAVAKFLNKESAVVLSEIKEIAAKGVSAKFMNKILLGGSAKFMAENGIKTDATSDMTEYYVAYDGKLMMKFELSDEIKEDAKECIREIEKLGIGIYMLTGDNEAQAKKVADKLGIKSVKCGVLPDEKAEFIMGLENDGRQVLMVGDGINDTLAMSYASVAVCMGSGADVSLERSDIVLLNDTLSSLLSSIKIAKHTLHVIKQNLAFSLCYNAMTVPLAVMGYIIPLFAAISMSLSSIVVILNSLRIRRKFESKI